MKTIQRGQQIGAEDIINGIQQGIKIVDATKPFISELFKKVSEWVSEIRSAPNSPAGRLKRIQALEAQNALQKEENKLNNALIQSLIERIETLEKKSTN